MAPKKGKKGKKDANKERELEEQRRKQAEEEQRLAEERAKRERELQEQRNRELLEQYFEKDQARLEDERVEMQQILDTKSGELTIMLDKIQRAAEWKKFLECSILPHPNSECDVNTYLGLWAEEAIHVEEDPSLVPLFNQLPNAEALLLQLELERAYAKDNRADKAWSRLHEHINKLLDILNGKWDSVSQQILQHVDFFSREPNENFQLTGTTDNYSFGIWGNLTRNPRHKTIEFNDLNMSASLPKPLVLSNVAIRMIHMTGVNCGVPYELQEGDGHRSFVGGILHLDLSEMPDPPKHVDAWTIRQILSPSGNLKRLEYPFKKTATEVAEEEGNDGANDSMMWSTLISFPIPTNVTLDSDSAKVMFWNAEFKMWDDDGITDDDIDLEAGRVKCRTTHFAPTAVVQNTYSELPYRDWMLESPEINRAVLHIYGKKNELHIDIREGECQVISGSPEVVVPKPLRNKWFPPSLLLKRLSQFGINFRGPQSMKGVEMEEWVLKNPAVEEACLQGISLCTTAMSFRRSPSNRLLASSKCAFQFREIGQAVDPAVDPEGGWRSLLFDVNYKVREQTHHVGFIPQDNNVTDDTKFKVDNDGSAIHASCFHLLRPLLKNADNAGKIERCSALFSKTVAQVLAATRVLCFS